MWCNKDSRVGWILFTGSVVTSGMIWTDLDSIISVELSQVHLILLSMMSRFFPLTNKSIIVHQDKLMFISLLLWIRTTIKTLLFFSVWPSFTWKHFSSHTSRWKNMKWLFDMNSTSEPSNTTDIMVQSESGNERREAAVSKWILTLISTDLYTAKKTRSTPEACSRKPVYWVTNYAACIVFQLSPGFRVHFIVHFSRHVSNVI